MLDEDEIPVDIGIEERRTANRLIEEFMLAANQTVAEHFYWMELPFIYRVHEKPDVEKIVELKDQIKTNYKTDIGEDKYNEQVETFNEGKEKMKESFEPVLDKVIEETKEIYDETVKNLDKWYKNWKEENN